MSLIVPILQVIALSVGGTETAGLSQAVLFEKIISIPEAVENRTVYPNSFREYVRDDSWSSNSYHSYFDSSSNWSADDHGYFMLFVLFDYLDRRYDDAVLAEANDWITDIQDYSQWDIHPSRAAMHLATIQDNDENNTADKFSFIPAFLDSQGIDYDPSLNSVSGTANNDDFFWKNAIEAYLTSRGFSKDEGTDPWLIHDFSVSYGRQGLWFDPVSGSGYTATPQADNLKYAVDNDLPVIFTTTNSHYLGVNSDYPFFCVGYTEYLFGGLTTYTFEGFSPYLGPVTFTESELACVAMVDFHKMHVHSNNVVLKSNGFAYCTCGTRTCYLVHDYHYQRVNNFSHRKTCSVCGDTMLEPHSGRFCICMLDD